MSLLQKINKGRKLLALQGKIHRDPDANFTPAIHKIVAEFTEQEPMMKYEREESVKTNVINKVVLGLYEGNTQLLRTDMIKVEIMGTEKATPAQRAALLRCICKALSLYTKEDLASIMEACGQYGKLVSDVKDEICRGSGTVSLPNVEMLVAEFIMRKNERDITVEQSVISTLLTDLYEGDIPALKKDIETEVMALDTAEAKLSDTGRRALFRSLCEVLSLHTEGDFSDITAMCDRLEAAFGTEDA